MTDNEIRFWKLVEVEQELNKIKISNIKTGSLLVNIYRETYLQRVNEKLFLSSLFFLKFFIRTVFPFFETRLPNNNKHVLSLIKSSNRFHSSKLIDPIYENFKSECALFQQGETNYYYSFINNIKSIIYTTTKIFALVNKSQKAFHLQGLPVSYLKIFTELFFSLHTSFVWQHYLKSSSIKILVVDHDRQKKNAPIICAAKSLNIKTITLMHGVINPPFGYTPLIANEIWVWGELQKMQLLKLGCTAEKIRIVGNPMIEKAVSKQYNGINKIGIAVNPIGDLKNEEIWKDKIEILNKEFSSKKIIVKLHPSMKDPIKQKEVFGDNCKIVTTEKLSIYEFFELVDILLVGNSSIAYEAIINQLPVLVTRENLDSTGNDYVMINQGNFPEITDNKIMIELIEKLIAQKESLTEIHNNELQFVNENVYFSTGSNASELIINNIKEIL